MGLSKVYRGYVIEDVNGQWYIRNAPNFTNGFPFNPGPHGGWTVATRQVDKLIEYTNRSNTNNRYTSPEQRSISSHDYSEYSGSESDTVGNWIVGVLVVIYIFAWIFGLKGM